MDGETRGDGGPLFVHNEMSGRADYVVQIGQVIGDVTVNAVITEADPVERAVRELALSVHAQWGAELRARDVAAEREPLHVRWAARWQTASASPDGAPATGHGHAGHGHGGDTRAGDAAALVDAFLSLSFRRLLLLGPPGSGKSVLAIHLTRELAARCLATAGAPVPVLLTLEGFDPAKEHFHAWVRRSLPPAARDRIPGQRLLPVLDGLDELPPHRRRQVLQGIDGALGRDDAVILASREDAYRETVAAGAEITRASTLTARPVELSEATAYLLRATPSRLHDRWRAVAEALASDPGAPLARALANPLMIWLASRSPAPEELLAHGEDVERRLLDAVFPAVFTEDPTDPDRLHAPGRWNPARARGWLTALARRLDAEGTAELAWWRLFRGPTSWLVTVAVLFGLSLGLARAAEAFTAWYAEDFSATLGMELSLSMGALQGALLWFAAEHWFGARRGEPRRRANPFRIHAALRSASRAASVRRAAWASVAVLYPAVITVLVSTEAFDQRPYLVTAVCGSVLAPLLMVAIAAPADTVDAATPAGLLADERRATLLSMAVVAPLIGIGQAAHDWFGVAPAAGVGQGVMGWFGAAAVLFLLSPWSRWLLAKCWLASRGVVPWSLMEFLRDAHAGGLLAQGGGTFRFRHLSLQRHLLAPTAPRLGGPVPAPRTAPAAGAPVPAARRSLRQEIRDVESRPAAGRKGWQVHQDDAHAFRVTVRQRGLPVAHWPALLLVAAVLMIRAALNGEPLRALVAAAIWCGFAALISLVGLARPPVTTELFLTPDHLAFRVGRRNGWLAWADVLAVDVQKVTTRGRDTKVYAVHVTLRPGAALPPRSFRSGGGRYCVLPLSYVPALPADVSAALARFAGARWTPPAAGLSPNGGPGA
ncbi:hypothetical protein FH609_015270 [Streptomyces sp. 3MP-14]|uniref:NACHT domain-containing protein n=1 Tax=Streptomyces mimosae TaxID=2586635 RepID=A0A5N6ABY9_9ACTN|nr:MULTISPECIES: NACHT domain-containing protein [Streptomyces]KAB8165765.1 hypothetical protein FH607_012595 [Streptomyces mimosae]KAB8176154.1 hypothetical protein FH609_015270 [Streptomyces sp. 3MP-14]